MEPHNDTMEVARQWRHKARPPTRSG